MGRHHLTGYESPPDEVVELVLVGGQFLAQRLRLTRGPGGPDGFVRFLRSLGFGKQVRFPGKIVRSVFRADQRPNRFERFLAQVARVGSHVGNQAGLTFGAAQVDAFVKLLGHAHRAGRAGSKIRGRRLL